MPTMSANIFSFFLHLDIHGFGQTTYSFSSEELALLESSFRFLQYSYFVCVFLFKILLYGTEGTKHFLKSMPYIAFKANKTDGVL